MTAPPGPAHDSRFVAGTGVERQRQTEVLGDGPERVVGTVVVHARRHLRGQEQRPEPLVGDVLGVVDGAVDVEHRHHPHRRAAGGRRTPPSPSCCTPGTTAAGTRRRRTRNRPAARTWGRSPRRTRRRAAGRGSGPRRRSRRPPRPRAPTPASTCADRVPRSATCANRRPSRCAAPDPGTRRRPARRRSRSARSRANRSRCRSRRGTSWVRR